MMSAKRVAAAVACVGVLSVASSAWSAPWGYRSDGLAGAAGGSAALAYAPDGTLYVADAADGSIVAIAPGGGRSTLSVTGVSLVSVGGMAVSSDGATLYVTDNKGWGDGSGDLYAVPTAGGPGATLLAGMDHIDDVAVRATGEVFVSEAAGADLQGAGVGGVYQVSAGTAGQVVGGLYYAAGLAFDSAGDLIYQQATDTFAGEVSRLPVGDSGAALAFGAPQLLAGGLAGAFDLTVDGEDDVFVTGVGGVYVLDRDAAGNFTGSASGFEAQGFSTEAAFVGGTNPFEGGAGYDGGHLTYVPEFVSADLADITTVPEPATLALLAGGALPALLARRARRPSRKR